MSGVKPRPPGVLLSIKAVPGAPRNSLCGWTGEELKVKVQAPPVDGKANEVLLEFIATTLGVPPRCVALERGGTSRHKVLRILGLDRVEVRRRLSL